jgi:ribose 1,5-bisphosphokinase
MVVGAAGGVNWFVDTRAFTRGDPRSIGPGRLVLVVGPSGAGKDTLIDGVRSLCADDPSVVFPRRVVTRPPCSAEDNECMSVEQFDRAQAYGSFALWWAAHGNKYGVPVSIDANIRAGLTVVCNTSRTILVEARRRYANVTAVLVTAPPDVLAARLAGRGRSSDGDLSARLNRSSVAGDASYADCVINNVRSPEVGIRRLLNVVRDHGFFLLS